MKFSNIQGQNKFYVSRNNQNLLVNDWYWPSWVGCFCLIKDKHTWTGENK